MDLNGNGITVSNAVWEEMKKHIPKGADGKPVHPIKADALKKVVEKYKGGGQALQHGHGLPGVDAQLRAALLARRRRHPSRLLLARPTSPARSWRDVLLSVTPPPQMPATMEAGTILGYCVGEPWNQAAVFKGIGVPVITDYEIWKNNPEKVFGMTADFAKKYPNTVLAVTKALIRAGHVARREQQRQPAARRCEILSKPEYVGADAAVIANSMTGTFEYEKGDKRAVPDFNVFFRYFATYPYYSDAVWYLTQMRRWGQITEAKPDGWYADIAKQVYRPDLYLAAAKLLVEEGKAKKEDFPWTSDGYREPTNEFIDGVTFDGRKPNAYIDGMAIGLKGGQRVDGAKVVSN